MSTDEIRKLRRPILDPELYPGTRLVTLEVRMKNHGTGTIPPGGIERIVKEFEQEETARMHFGQIPIRRSDAKPWPALKGGEIPRTKRRPDLGAGSSKIAHFLADED